MTASYLVKAPRKNGTAVKKPGRFKRFLKFFLPWKGDTFVDIIRKLIFIVALIVFLVTAIPLATDLFSMYKDQWEAEKIALDVNFGTGEEPNEQGILPSMAYLKSVNPETVGWIQITGTNINYPVVQHSDNDYYLTHDFNMQESRSGSIMLDYACKIAPEGNSANLVLYGHHMAAGTFFANLRTYWDSIYDQNDPMYYYKEHPIINFNTLYEEAQWKIFAIGLYNTEEQYGEVYDYNNIHDFANAEAFNDYIIDIMDRSDIFTDVDVQYGDELLTLSTCVWPWWNYSGMENTRLAITARKLRPGESADVDVDAATVNYSVKRWKFVYDRTNNGYDWFQSTWDRRKLLSYTEQEAAQDGYTFLD